MGNNSKTHFLALLFGLTAPFLGGLTSCSLVIETRDRQVQKTRIARAFLKLQVRCGRGRLRAAAGHDGRRGCGWGRRGLHRAGRFSLSRPRSPSSSSTPVPMCSQGFPTTTPAPRALAGGRQRAASAMIQPSSPRSLACRRVAHGPIAAKLLSAALGFCALTVAPRSRRLSRATRPPVRSSTSPAPTRCATCSPPSPLRCGRERPHLVQRLPVLPGHRNPGEQPPTTPKCGQGIGTPSAHTRVSYSPGEPPPSRWCAVPTTWSTPPSLSWCRISCCRRCSPPPVPASPTASAPCRTSKAPCWALGSSSLRPRRHSRSAPRPPTSCTASAVLHQVAPWDNPLTIL